MAASNFREAFFELCWICIHSYCLKSMTDRGESTLLNESVLSASWSLLFRTVITKWTWKIDQFLSSIFGVESLGKENLHAIVFKQSCSSHESHLPSTSVVTLLCKSTWNFSVVDSRKFEKCILTAINSEHRVLSISLGFVDNGVK